ncbi:PREDICTED: nucleosome assembly protein 1;1-like [Acromyrmex echinatior]|uniref:nucleosome assembly protein 1;1-like n=1 Tax=Acromyrmex echinatior TaxID=103372 RepID=UPI000581070F|nr:PREDICTED: nucleosome assembly protein 1;1-like [Acromyrmex echinatior]
MIKAIKTMERLEQIKIIANNLKIGSTKIIKALGWGDLVAICNILAIDNTGIKKELSQRICNYLIDLNMLDKANDDRKDAEKDDDDDNDDDNDEINEEEAEEVNEDKDKDGEMN